MNQDLAKSKLRNLVDLSTKACQCDTGHKDKQDIYMFIYKQVGSHRHQFSLSQYSASNLSFDLNSMHFFPKDFS